MLIGNCQFDEVKGTLTGSDDIWNLPRAELQVLRLLVSHRGTVVCKQVLRQGQGEGAVLSESSVARAVFILRSHLGPQFEYLIETVKGQGYLLLPQPEQFSLQGSPPSSLWSYTALILGIAIAATVGIWSLHRLLFVSHIITQVSDSPMYSSQVMTGTGRSIGVSLFTKSKTNSSQLLQQTEQLKLALGSCVEPPWEQVYLSLSHDGQVLNITMRGNRHGQSEVRNLKISDSREPREFINPAWLQLEGICE